MLSKTLNILASFILYGCAIVLTVGMSFNFVLHEVFGFKLYTLEAIIILIVCIVVGSTLSNIADNIERKKFHEYCKRNNIPSNLDNYNEYQMLLMTKRYFKNDEI